MPAEGLAIDFVGEADRAQLGEIVRRVQDERLWTSIRVRHENAKAALTLGTSKQG